MRRRLLIRACATLLFVIAGLQTGEAYLRQSYLVGDQRVSVTWAERRIDYFVSDRGVDGVSVDAFEAALQRATASWQAAPGSAITFRYAGRTAARPLDLDGRNTVGFVSSRRPRRRARCHGHDYRPDLRRGRSSPTCS